MIKRSSQVLCVWFVFWDLVLTAAAWLGAYYVRFASGWIPIYKPPPEVILCWRNLPLVLLVGVVAYHLAGQYTIHRLYRFREEMVGARPHPSLTRGLRVRMPCGELLFHVRRARHRS